MYIFNDLIELRPWILKKVPFWEFLTSGKHELNADCKICHLQVSKGGMVPIACMTIAIIKCL